MCTHTPKPVIIIWFQLFVNVSLLLIFSPAMLEKNEVSVYDLKDHPDFEYRPETVVIRVANFEGEDANCTAGQVLDNYPEGMVRILLTVYDEILQNGDIFFCHNWA